MSIPKVIHYCWFGENSKPKLAEKCIKSWRRYCPDYKIIEWNETNFNVNQNKYCKQAYEAKKWAFVTDYARLAILYQYGGIYFDTDVEVIRNIDDLLKHCCFMGIENSDRNIQVNTGLGMGAEKNCEIIREMLQDYEDIPFLKSNGEFDITTCTVRNTNILKKYGYVEENCNQRVKGVEIFSSEYFSPMNMESGIVKKTKNTYSIHHYSLSWTSKEHQEERKKAIKAIRRKNYIYNVKVFPNKVCMKLLGKQNYQKMKQMIGRK